MPPVETLDCEAVAPLLQELLDGNGTRAAALAEHLEHCLACHGDLARYRRLLRLLGQLRDERAQLPPGLLADVLGAIGSAAERGARRSAIDGRRVTYAVVIVTASALVSAALVIARVRPRVARGVRAKDA